MTESTRKRERDRKTKKTRLQRIRGKNRKKVRCNYVVLREINSLMNHWSIIKQLCVCVGYQARTPGMYLSIIDK